MAKRNLYALTDEEVIFPYEEMLESTAILMWNTSYSDFTFAFYLNQLFGLELERRKDISLSTMKEEIQCSVFSYDDKVNHQSYFLIENGLASRQSVKELSYYDKTLLILGADAFERAEPIYDELKEPMRNSVDLLAMQREELRTSFVNSGIVESAWFNFADPDNPESSIIATRSPLNKKQKAFIDFQKDYIQGIFVELDDLLPNYDE